jgi:class 3 adenylate cyclase
LDYTVIGDTVNVAARLQAAANRGQILVSEACYVAAKNLFRFEKVGSFDLKNREKPVLTYEILE